MKPPFSHKPGVIAALAVATPLLLPLIASAQVKVLISGGFSGPYEKLLPEFERTAGVKVTTESGSSQGTGPQTIGAQLARGVPVDVVILSREGLTELMGARRIAAGTDVDLARTPLGVAVRAGTRKPDVRTVEAFKQVVTNARAVAVPSSTSGIFLEATVFPRLGISGKVHVVATPRGTGAAALVASGDADVAVMPVSEIVHAPGVELAGVIAAEIQLNQIFAAAVVAGSKQAEAAKQLIAFLASQRAAATIVSSGMEPLSKRPGFEVASVKQSGSLSPEGFFRVSPGRFSVDNLSLRWIIQYAYRIRPYQLFGAPAWADQNYDIRATVADTAATNDDVRGMLQALLADRFHLEVRREQRRIPTYALVRAGSDETFGPRLARSAVDCTPPAAAQSSPGSASTPPRGCAMFVTSWFIRGFARTMPQLAQTLESLVVAPVADRTGLSGAFDFNVEWGPAGDLTQEAVLAPDQLAALSTAVREQLGLRLQAAREPAEVIVITSVTRPTPD